MGHIESGTTNTLYFIGDLNGDQELDMYREGPNIFNVWTVGLENCEKIWYVETPNEY